MLRKNPLIKMTDRNQVTQVLFTGMNTHKTSENLCLLSPQPQCDTTTPRTAV